MPKRPLIAINCDIKRNKDKCAEFLCVYADYVDAIEAAGGAPVLIPPLGDEDILRELPGRVDGLVLVGGEDLDPCVFGQEIHKETRRMFSRRQEFDLCLIRVALAARLPILAICGGHQEINVALGGTLHQHIPDAYGIQVIHTRADDLSRTGREQTHSVAIEDDSLLARVVATIRIEVNSSHHQSIDRAGEGLRAVATAQDGVVEALEYADGAGAGFLLSVQWHPERMRERPEHSALFEALVEAAAKRAGSGAGENRL